MDDLPYGLPTGAGAGSGSGGGIGPSINPVGDVYVPPRGTTPGTEGPKLENLGNVADTWGKVWPMTAGNIRVKCYQVWASDFFEVKDTTTTTTTPKYPDIDYNNEDGIPTAGGGYLYFNTVTGEAGDIGGDGDDPILPGEGDIGNGANLAGDTNNVSTAQPITDPEQFFNAYIDVAYSGGYNMLLSSRVVGDVLFDGTPVYTYETRSNKFAFNFHEGVISERDSLILKDLGTDTTYFPEQNYLVFKELSLSASKGALPKDVEVLFRVQSISGDVVERDDIDEDVVPEGRNFPDWDNRRLYVYVDSEGPNGTIYEFDIDTLKKLKDYEVNLDSDGPIGNPVWYPKQQLMVGQIQAAGFAGSSRIYAISIKTGETKAYYGDTEFPGVAPMSIRYADNSIECGGNENNGSWIYVINPFEYVYFGVVSGNADSDVTINVAEKGEWSEGPFADYIARGTNGAGFFIKDGKIYRCSQAGVEFVRDEVEFAENYLCVGTDLVALNPEGRVMRYKGNGSLLYNNLTDLLDEYGLSSINLGDDENRKITEYPDIIANTIAGSTNNYKAYYINLNTGKVEVYDSDPERWTTGQLWDGFNAKLVVLQPHGGTGEADPGYVQLPFRELGGEILLSDFIRAVFTISGKFTAEQITFDESIDYKVLGGGIFQTTTIGAVIKDICAVYRIDFMENEGGVHFFHNRFIASPADVLATIKVEDLALISEGGADDPQDFRTELRSAISASSEISLSFIDPAANYATNTVVWTNPNADFHSSGTAQFTIPLVITKDEALTLIRALYSDANTTKTKHTFRLPRSHNFYTKGDVLTIVDGNFRETVRITQTDFNADYSVSVEADNVSMRYFVKVTVPDKPQKPKRISGSSTKTNGIVFDIPTIIAEHNDIPDGKLLQYMHLYGDDPSWISGYFARKSANWRSVYKSGKGSKPIVYKCDEVLGNVFWEADDTPMAISSVYGKYDKSRNTEYSRLYGSAARNLALYGAPGRWEVIQVREISDGAVRGCLRGLRGTEAAAALHEPGDLLVFVSQAFTRENRNIASIGNTVQYRAVTVGRSFLAGPLISHTVEGNSLKPFAPFNVEAFFDTDDIQLTWDRRDRAGNGWGVTPPMSEDAESYEIDIYDGLTVVRTIDSLSPDALYTEAQQIADGLGGITELTLCVYQISDSVGRGFGNKVTINVY